MMQTSSQTNLVQAMMTKMCALCALLALRRYHKLSALNFEIFLLLLRY